MNWMRQIESLLHNYSPEASYVDTSKVDQHFDQITQAAPHSEVAQGLAEAFRSGATPPFEEMLAELFRQSSDQQKAGILNRLLQAAGPEVRAHLGLPGASGPGEVSAAQARTVPAHAVKQTAAQISRQNGSVIDAASDFYAQHPTLVKKLGGAALTIALAKMARSINAM